MRKSSEKSKTVKVPEATTHSQQAAQVQLGSKRSIASFFEKGRFGRLVVKVMLVVLVYGLLVGVALPAWLPGFVSRQMSEALQARCTVAAITINPFTLDVTIGSLRIDYPESADPFLELGGIESAPSILSLFLLEPGLRYLHILEPKVHVSLREDGALSVLDFVPKSDAAPAQPDADIFPFVVQDLRVQNGTITFRDAMHNATHTVTDFQLDVPMASSLKADVSKDVQPVLQAMLDGTPIHAVGKTTPFSQHKETVFDIEISGLTLEKFRSYLVPYTDLLLEQGDLRSALRLSVSVQDTGMDISLSGTLEVTDLLLRDPADEAALVMRRGAIELESSFSAPGIFTFTTIEFDSPVILLRRDAKGKTNWEEYFTPFFVAQAEAAKQQAAAAQKSQAAVGEKAMAANATRMVQGNGTGVSGDSSSSSLALVGGVLGNATHQNSTLVHAVGNGTNGGVGTGQVASGKPDSAGRVQESSLIAVESLQVRNGTIVYLDAGLPGGQFAHTIRNINATMLNFATDAAAPFDFAVSFGTADAGGVMRASGNATLALAVQASLEADNFDVTPVASIVSAVAGIDMKSARVSSTLHIRAQLPQSDKDVLQAWLDDGTITLQNVVLHRAKESAPALQIGNLSVAGLQVDLAKQKVAIASAKVAMPYAKIERSVSGAIGLGKGRASPEPVIPNATVQEKTAGEVASAKPWLLNLKALDATLTALEFVDNALKNQAKLEYTAVRVQGQNITTESGKPMSLTFQLSWGKEGTIKGSGKGTLVPLDLDVDIALSKLGFAPYSPYLREFSTLSLESGGIGEAQLTVSVLAGRDASAPLEIAAAFDGYMGGLSVKDARNNELFGVERLDLRGLRYASGKQQSLQIGTIEMRKPRTFLALFESGMNSFSRAFDITGQQEAALIASRKAANKKVAAASASQGAAKPAGTRTAQTVQSKPLLPDFSRLEIGRVLLVDGTVKVKDESVKPAFTTTVTGVAVDVSGLSAAANTRAKLIASAQMDGAPIAVNGTAAPLRDPVFTDVHISVTGVDMVPLSSYAEKYIAYPISRGQFSGEFSFKLENRMIDSDNDIFLGKFELGDKIASPNAPDLPVQLGLSLLRDSDGNISLSLPVQGSLDDPSFHTGGLVAKVLGNALAGIITSPFSLLGNVVGLIGDIGGSSMESLNHVTFTAGDDRLTPQAQANLKTVATMLAQRSKLRLSIQGHAAAVDRAALVTVNIEKELQQLKYESLSRRERSSARIDQLQVGPETDAAEYEELLFKVYSGRDFEKEKTMFTVKRQPAFLMLQLIQDNTEVTDADLENLALERAKAVRNALILIDPSLALRISLARSAGPASGGKGPQVSLTLE